MVFELKAELWKLNTKFQKAPMHWFKLKSCLLWSSKFTELYYKAYLFNYNPNQVNYSIEISCHMLVWTSCLFLFFSLIKNLPFSFFNFIFSILDKCRLVDCGKGQCQVNEINETYYEATCLCENGYEFNKYERKCESCEFNM